MPCTILATGLWRDLAAHRATFRISLVASSLPLARFWGDNICWVSIPTVPPIGMRLRCLTVAFVQVHGAREIVAAGTGEEIYLYVTLPEICKHQY